MDIGYEWMDVRVRVVTSTTGRPLSKNRQKKTTGIDCFWESIEILINKNLHSWTKLFYLFANASLWNPTLWWNWIRHHVELSAIHRSWRFHYSCVSAAAATMTESFHCSIRIVARVSQWHSVCHSCQIVQRHSRWSMTPRRLNLFRLMLLLLMLLSLNRPMAPKSFLKLKF